MNYNSIKDAAAACKVKACNLYRDLHDMDDEVEIHECITTGVKDLIEGMKYLITIRVSHYFDNCFQVVSTDFSFEEWVIL